MDKENQYIENLLGEAFRGKEIITPPNSWQHLKKKLAFKKFFTPNLSNKANLFKNFNIMHVALLSVISTGSYFMLTDNTPSVDNVEIQQKMVTDTTQQHIEKNDTTKEINTKQTNKKSSNIQKEKKQKYVFKKDCPPLIEETISTNRQLLKNNDKTIINAEPAPVNIKPKTEKIDVNSLPDTLQAKKTSINATMPTVFSPNGDGLNDIIKIRGTDIKQLISLRIFNSWGKEVFSTTDINEGWDGYHKGKKQPMGDYVYTFIIETYQGERIKKQGSFKLVR